VDAALRVYCRKEISPGILWRARLISNRRAGAGAALVLVLEKHALTVNPTTQPHVSQT
jgi:hypothetical protein